MQINLNLNPNPAQAFAPSPMGAPNPQMGNQTAAMMQMMMGMMTMMMTMLQSSGGALPGMPNFGAASGGGVAGLPGGPGLLGSSGAAPSSASGASSVADPSSVQGAEWGKDLAKAADAGATGSGGWCFKFAGQALRKFGVNTSGASAYMAADQLAQSPKFKEVQMNPKEFKKLPPGAVVVWDKGPGKPHGHISIALGDGREASDVRQPQVTNYGTKARVFIPK